MPNEPLVTIAINNYNYGRFLGAAIDSALQQTYPHIEVIVVDDGSTDNSREVIAEYGDKILPILQENGGQASAFNSGFEASRGEIICLLDADDLFVPTKVAEVVEALQENRDRGWCFHPQQWVDAQLNPIPGGQKEVGLSAEYDFREPLKRGKLNNYLPPSGLPATSAFCFRRSLLEKMLPMPEIPILSDNYLKFLALALTPGYVINRFLSIQRIHQNNAYTDRNDRFKTTARIEILTAYWMRHYFPEAIWTFSNNCFANGIAASWKSGGLVGDSRDWIDKYLASTPWRDRLTIYLKSVYYYLQ